VNQPSGIISLLDKVTPDLFGTTARRALKQELAALIGGLEPFEAMEFLHSNGIRCVILPVVLLYAC
jgi:hypothetical protein